MNEDIGYLRDRISTLEDQVNALMDLLGVQRGAGGNWYDPSVVLRLGEAEVKYYER